MRIRSTKPEFWRSKLIASVSWDARLVLKALESYVDDNGVGEDDVNTLVGDCFLHDLIREPSRTLARVSEAISELHQAGLIWRYDVEGRNLLYVSFWETIQRIDKPLAGRNPRPDGTLKYKESIIRESVATSREDSRSLAPGTGEQGNRGTGEQGKKLSNDQRESSDCNAREFSSEELEEVKEMLGETIRDTLDDLETSVAVELITEAAAVPVENLPAYIRASIDASPDRITGLVREAIRQVSRTRS